MMSDNAKVKPDRAKIHFSPPWPQVYDRDNRELYGKLDSESVLCKYASNF